MGMSFNPLGLLWDEEVREHVKPVGCHTYGPMHALLSNGICQNESGLLLLACRDAGVPFSAFRDFAKADWKFFRAHGQASILRGCFSEAREKAWKDGFVFRAGAAEMLIAFGVILHFLLTIVSPRGLLADEIASFCALGKALHLLLCGKSGSEGSRELASAIQRHAAAFLKAYPSAEVKPKPLRPSCAIAIGTRWLRHGRVYWGAQAPAH